MHLAGAHPCGPASVRRRRALWGLVLAKKSTTSLTAVTMQAMMREAAEGYVARQERGVEFAKVISTLKALKPQLVERGVTSLSVFGSAARGDNSAGSDIDLVVDIAKDAKMSLTGFSCLRLDLQDALGRKVDLVRWPNLEPRIRESVERDAVRVF